MATVKAIKYGMKSDDVSNLQTALKNAGYNVDVDGSFGPQTLAAVKQYQQANGLDVDGMVGPQTQAKLFGNTNAPTATTNPISTTTGTNAKAAQINYPGNFEYNKFAYDDYKSNGAVDKATEKPFSYEDFTYGNYQESETVTKAQTALDELLASQPGAYQSKWQSQLDDIIGRILNREAFNYNFNEDALYKQYAEQYMRRGKLAMQDTMGQAAAMTGGYGNSYASVAGNQAYQEYLSQLNEIIPELYGMALERYQMEGQDMYNQYGILSDREQQEYGRHQDAYNQWLAERDYAAGRYDRERELDHSKYVDDRNFAYNDYSEDRNLAYNEYLNAVENAKWKENDEYNKYLNDRNFKYGAYSEDRNLAYNEYLNAIERAQFDAQHEENIRQYEQNLEYQKDRDRVSDQQWADSFAYQKEQDSDAKAYRDMVYADSLKQQDIDNAYRDKVFEADEKQRETENARIDQAQVRQDALTILSTGGTISDEMVKATGLPKNTLEAMAAVESGDEKAALEHVASMTYEDIIYMVEGFIEDDNMFAAGGAIDDAYLAGRIDLEEVTKLKKYYKIDEEPEVVDTTVPANKSNLTRGVGGKIKERY